MRDRRQTTTSSFGVSRRESHDATRFYDRFRPPQLSDDADVPLPEPVGDPFVHGDARNMGQVADAASGSCAWGSFRSAVSPVLRDVTERVIVASKGRFDRARSVIERARDGLPHESTLPADDFMALTLDVWSIPAESATRVG